jgi:hypothetical protein
VVGGGDALWDQAYVDPVVTVHPDGGQPWGSARDPETARHIAVNDPEGVLATVAADRALITEHAPRVNWNGDVVCSRCIEQDIRMYRTLTPRGRVGRCDCGWRLTGIGRAISRLSGRLDLRLRGTNAGPHDRVPQEGKAPGRGGLAVPPTTCSTSLSPCGSWAIQLNREPRSA